MTGKVRDKGTKSWDGREWEEHVLMLLRLRYATGDLQAIPDEDQGDLGLEAFSRDGCTYQCYAHDGVLKIKERYEKQRAKLTRDIGKFVKKPAKMQALLGNVVVRRWVFIVPVHDSKRLNEHAAAKAEWVRSLGLPYIADDFDIHIATEDDFLIELNTLLVGGLAKIPAMPGVDSSAVSAWEIHNPDLISKLNSKIDTIAGFDEPQRVKFRGIMLRSYLTSENILEKLRIEHPQIYEKFATCKAEREDRLEVDSLLSDASPRARLREVEETFRRTILEEVPAIHSATATTLTNGSIADWLIRCPLEFRANATS